MIGSNSGEPGFDAARTIASKAGDTGAGAWLYNFAYVPSFRKAEWKKGAIHSAELMFAFNSIDTSSWGVSNRQGERRRSCHGREGELMLGRLLQDGPEGEVVHLRRRRNVARLHQLRR